MDGNETTVNGQTAGYDFENHLVSLANAANNTVLASYTYDADGNRIATYISSNNPTTTSYVVDTSMPYASVIEEYSGTSTMPSARYDYGDDLVRMDRGSSVYYYLYDGLGSTRQLVNTAGAVTDSYGYSAFGELALHTSTGTPTVNPFLFNAQQFDQASGDYYLRARYYDQSNGRFLSQDPLGGHSDDPITLHRYVYGNDDPVDVCDPSGREGEGGLSGQSLVTTIGQYINSFATSVVVKAGIWAAENPGLVTAALYAQGAINLYTVATDPDSAALAAATGGFSSDVEFLTDLAGDARKAFTVYRDAETLTEDCEDVYKASGIVARLTSDSLRRGLRRDPAGKIKPAGLSTLKSSGFTYAKGHLLGDKLGGSPDVQQNFVAMYQTANQRMYNEAEYPVKHWLEDNPNGIIYYRATPVFEDGQDFPTRVIVEAESADGRFKLNGTGSVTIENTPN